MSKLTLHILIFSLIFSVSAFLYLYLSYTGFYNFIGEVNLQCPYTENSMIIENPQGTGTVKYVALGDSLSAGIGTSDVQNTFVCLYAVNLSKKYQKVNLLNLAQSGNTTSDVIENQIPNAIPEKPDYITLLVGINDIHQRHSLDDFQRDYSIILEELLSKTDAQITVINIPYLGSDKIVHFPFNIVLDYRTRQFNKAISDTVGSLSTDRIKLVDLYTKTYKLSEQNPGYYSADFFHPRDEGYILWEQIIDAD